MKTRVLCVIDRLSTKGGAERYLREVASGTAATGGVEWHVAYGHRDATGDDLGDVFASCTRVRGLDRRVPHSKDDVLRARLGELAEQLGPHRIVVQNVMSPAAIDALGRLEGAILIVQDHRTFCPARGKVFPDGSPCEEIMGPACDRCFSSQGELDRELRDRRLELTRARLAAARLFPTVVVLSSYMRSWLEREGLVDGLRVVPPAVSAWAQASELNYRSQGRLQFLPSGVGEDPAGKPLQRLQFDPVGHRDRLPLPQLVKRGHRD